jgi:hypothetical protein
MGGAAGGLGINTNGVAAGGTTAEGERTEKERRGGGARVDIELPKELPALRAANTFCRGGLN